MPPIQRKSQYRQLADRLRDDIDQGVYTPGSKLPAQPELARIYEISEPGVNRAIAILAAEGYVRAEMGRGTFVRPIPVLHRRAATRYQRVRREANGGRGAFDTELRSLGLTPRSDVEVVREVPPPRVARQLGLAETAEVVVRRRRMYANDVPVQFAPSYIPLDLAEGTALEEIDSGPGGIVSRFVEMGHPQTRITEEVRVRRATDEEASFLRLGEDQPVMEIWHVAWSDSGHEIEIPVEVCVHAIPAYLWVLEYEIALAGDSR